MPMDIELQSVNDPEKRIKVLYPHWEQVLKKQGQWEPVADPDRLEAREEEIKPKPPKKKAKPPKKKTRATPKKKEKTSQNSSEKPTEELKENAKG